MELKLAKLPDRAPVKITITVKPALNAALQAYAELYRETYGESETVAELIPYMLQNFLDGDRNFAKRSKQGNLVTAKPRPRTRPGLRGRNATEHRKQIHKLQAEETAMSVIGRFTPNKDGGWIGTIRTLTIDVKGPVRAQRQPRERKRACI